MHQYAVCWVDKKSQPEVQGECVSIAPFDCGFYRIVASIVAVRVRQDNVLRGGEWFEKLSDPANTSGPRTRFFRTVFTAAVAFCNQFSFETNCLIFLQTNLYKYKILWISSDKIGNISHGRIIEGTNCCAEPP